MSQISRTISYLKRNGLASTVNAVTERLGLFGPDPDQKKAQAYVSPDSDDTKIWKAEEDFFPKYSIVVPAYETKEIFFREMLESVKSQSYENWQLVIADASPKDDLEHIVSEYGDDRICYVRLKENKGIAENTNEGLKYADGDYIGLLDHDDLLTPDALMEINRLLSRGDYEMVYSDEDKTDEEGKRFFEPNFKPDFNFDFLLSNNYICHFTVIKAELMQKLTFRPAFNGAQDYALFLQAVYELECKRKQEGHNGPAYADSYMKKKIGHVSKVLYHWRAHTASTADNPESKRYAYEAGKRALMLFASLNQWDVEVEHTKHLGFYEMRYKPDIFTVRDDVVGVCGRRIKNGRVITGPMMDGKELFRGMNVRYSGYMHKAQVKFDATHSCEECIKYRSAHLSKKEIEDGKIVYLPEFIVRK